MREHLTDSCPKRSVSCPNGCAVSCSPAELRRHLDEECDGELVCCPHSCYELAETTDDELPFSLLLSGRFHTEPVAVTMSARTKEKPTWREGMLLDVLDTEKAWLVAQVLDVLHSPRTRVQLLKVAFLGLGSKWDELIDSDSPRLARLQTRTTQRSLAMQMQMKRPQASLLNDWEGPRSCGVTTSFTLQPPHPLRLPPLLPSRGPSWLLSTPRACVPLSCCGT